MKCKSEVTLITTIKCDEYLINNQLSREWKCVRFSFHVLFWPIELLFPLAGREKVCSHATPAETDSLSILHVRSRFTNSRDLANSVMMTLPWIMLLLSSFPVSHKVGNVVNFVLGIEIKGIWSNSINLVLQLK